MGSTPSTVYETYINASDASESRANDGVKEGDFRLINKTLNVNNLTKECEQMVADFYQRRVNEMKRGEYMPTPVRSWNGVVNAYVRCMVDRIPENVKRANASDDVSILCIPFCFKAPHPTKQEQEAYMRRYDDEGDLYITVSKEVKKCLKNKDKQFGIIPWVLSGEHSKSMVMMCLTIIIA